MSKDSASTEAKPRVPRWQKAAMLTPVVVVVAAWTANLGSADEQRSSSSPDPGIPSVPATGFEDPASVTKPPSVDPDSYVTDPNHNTTQPGTTAANASNESANGIPAAALTAYQRTEAVLAQADPACHLPWELVAAIGRVESDHGRHGGNVLGADGTARPGIYGLALNGRGGTAMVSDSDGGDLDRDSVYDRAVGPMQFIPTTWDIVGVDADGDKVRNPQDIDDAALAAGVYLCAGENDLSTEAGQRAAVYSYNHSQQYVALVLAIMRAYEDGNFSSVENGLPSNNDIPAAATTDHPKPKPGHKPGQHGGTKPGSSTGGGNNGGGSHHGGTGGNGNGNGGNGNGGNGNGGGTPTEQPKPDNPLKPVEDTVTNTVDPVVEATRVCTSALASADIPQTASRLQQCVNAYLNGGVHAVNNLVSGLLDTLGLGGLLGGGSGGSSSSGGSGGGGSGGGGGLLGGLLGGGGKS